MSYVLFPVLGTFLYNELNLSPAAWDKEEEVEED